MTVDIARATARPRTRRIWALATMIGVAAGAKSELNLLALMGKRARIYGSTLRARPPERREGRPAPASSSSPP